MSDGRSTGYGCSLQHIQGGLPVLIARIERDPVLLIDA